MASKQEITLKIGDAILISDQIDGKGSLLAGFTVTSIDTDDNDQFIHITNIKDTSHKMNLWVVGEDEE